MLINYSNIPIEEIINNPYFILFGTVIINLFIILKIYNIIKFGNKFIIDLFRIVKLFGYILISISCLFVIRNLINLSFEESAKHLLSAIGLLAILSNLCFSLSNHVEPEHKVITVRAGKRFMLATILLGFCILLSYISSHSHIVRTNFYITLFRDLIYNLTNILVLILGFAFTYRALEGFTIIYNYLLEYLDLKFTDSSTPKNKNDSIP